MYIRTKFRINILFTLGVVATIGIVMMYTSMLSQRAINNEKIANEIIQGAFEISLVANNYFLHHEVRATQQWTSRHKSLEILISNVSFETLEQKTLLQTLEYRHARLNNILLQLLSLGEKNNEGITPLESRLIERFMENSHILASTASHLSEIMKAIADDSQRTSDNIVLFLIALMSIVIAYLSKTFSNSIILPIMQLQKGVDNLQKGTFTHKTPIYIKKDSNNILTDTNEIIQLEKAFNTMATKLHTQHHELLEREKNLAITINSITDAIITINSTGEILSINNATIIIFGYNHDELIEKNITKLIPDTHSKSFNAYLESFLHTNKKSAVNCGRVIEGLHKSNGVFPLRLSFSELPLNKTGEPRFIGTFQDITDITQKDEQLQRSQKMDALGQLTGGVAHDFNNILGIILGNTELLQLLVSDNEKAAKRLHDINKSAKRAAELTRKLLSFSTRHQSNQLVTDINKIISELETLLVRSITPEIKINFQLTDDIWATQVNIGDFEDVLLNLVMNSRDAIKSDGIIRIETKNTYLDDTYCEQNSDATPGDYVEIIISDNGSGISTDNLLHIFEPFFSTKAQDKGTGLGLAMAYGFIARSGGHINVHSELNIGTTFQLYLPRNESKIQTSALNIDEEISPPGGSETILVVDDEAGLLTLAKILLQSLGYKVLTAATGQQALEILNENSDIDLLFSDVVMPNGINGYELAELTEAINSNIKILLTSGYTNKTVTGTNKSSYKPKLLGKPYTHLDLAIRLRELLN